MVGSPNCPNGKAEVNSLGLTTDTQRNQKVHGGPDKAICLYPVEQIKALQQEGHPIYAGSIGENLTVIGIDWQTMTIGSRWQIGAEVQIEITSYAYPCKYIGESFVRSAIYAGRAETPSGLGACLRGRFAKWHHSA